jgi:hypothetical protein
MDLNGWMASSKRKSVKPFNRIGNRDKREDSQYYMTRVTYRVDWSNGIDPCLGWILHFYFKILLQTHLRKCTHKDRIYTPICSTLNETLAFNRGFGRYLTEWKRDLSVFCLERQNIWI